MASREILEETLNQIERVKGSSFLRYEVEGEAFHWPHLDLPGPPERGREAHLAWEALTHRERANVLEREIDWTGLDREQRFDVIENVLAGKDRANWLDGVRTDAERDADEAAARESAAGRGNGSPDSEPYIRREWLAHAQDTAEALRRGGGFVKCEDGLVVGERRFDPEIHGPAAGRIKSWRDLDEHEKLSALMTSDATDSLGREDTHAFLGREVDLERVPEEVQRHWLGEVIRPHQPQDLPHLPESGERIHLPPVIADAEPASPEIRQFTHQLIESAIFDTWPSIGAIVDFGIDSDRHLGALHHAIRYELVTPEELDAAMGKGQKLTEIAQRGRNPYGDVTFKTAWDDLLPAPEDFEERMTGEGAASEPEKPPDQEGSQPRQDERFIALLFSGAPMPHGWKLPARSEPAEFSNPDALQHARERIADLKLATFDSWQSVPSDLPANVIAPGHTGGWNEMTEAGKLHAIQCWVEWVGVSLRDMAQLVAEEIDLSRLSEKVRAAIMRDAGMEPVAAARGKGRDKDPGFEPEI